MKYLYNYSKEFPNITKTTHPHPSSLYDLLLRDGLVGFTKVRAPATLAREIVNKTIV